MKILDVTNFLRYRAPVVTSLRAEWATLCKLSFTLPFFTLLIGFLNSISS